MPTLIAPALGETFLTMTARRDGSRVLVTFYPLADDTSRREAARVVRTYTRTVSGHVTAHARFTSRDELAGGGVLYVYTLTD